MKKEFVINWFVDKSAMTKDELEKDLNINYMEQGLIDSFAFLELIAACEKKFGFSFSDNDFSDERFFTISGLIETLEKY